MDTQKCGTLTAAQVRVILHTHDLSDGLVCSDGVAAPEPMETRTMVSKCGDLFDSDVFVCSEGLSRSNANFLQLRRQRCQREDKAVTTKKPMIEPPMTEPR